MFLSALSRYCKMIIIVLISLSLSIPPSQYIPFPLSFPHFLLSSLPSFPSLLCSLFFSIFVSVILSSRGILHLSVSCLTYAPLIFSDTERFSKFFFLFFSLSFPFGTFLSVFPSERLVLVGRIFVVVVFVVVVVLLVMMVVLLLLVILLFFFLLLFLVLSLFSLSLLFCHYYHYLYPPITIIKKCSSPIQVYVILLNIKKA